MTRHLSLFLTIAAAAAFLTAGCQRAPSGEVKEHGGQLAFEEYCTDCHVGSRALGGSRSESQWRALTERMSDKREQSSGTGIPMEVQDEIVDYLMKEGR